MEESASNLWQVLVRRASQFTSVAWSPDGRRLAAGAWDGCIWLFDAASGAVQGALEGHEGCVHSVVWSPDSSRLASGSHDWTIRVWDASSGEPLFTSKDHENPVSSVAWSPNGSYLASGSWDKTVRVWDAFTGKSLRVCQGHANYVWGVAWSPDSSRLASGSWDNTARIWDASSGKHLVTYNGHRNLVLCVAWSPDASRVASGSSDKTVRIWDASSGHEVVAGEGHEGDVECVAWSLDGSQLASGSWDETVRIWDVSSGNQLLEFRDHKSHVQGVAWGPDSSRIASASMDATVRIWKASSGKELLICHGHQTDINGMAWSPDFLRFASASSGSTVRIQNASSGEQLLTCEGNESRVRSLAWSPDGARVAAGLDNGAVRGWATASGEAVFAIQGPKDPVSGMAWSADSSRLASVSSDKSLRISGASSGEHLITCQGHEGAVNCMAWSPDGLRLASGANDKTVRVWNPSTGECTEVLRAHTRAIAALAWLLDGRLMVSCDGRGETILWHTPHWNLQTIAPAVPFVWRACSFVLSPDEPPVPPEFRDSVQFRKMPLVPFRSSAPVSQTRFHCARVVLIGDGGAGKSSLAYRLLHDEHIERGSTHGLQVWKIPAQKLYPEAEIAKDDSREVFLWDLGGQPAYRILHQLFFPDTRLAVFVFYPRASNDLEVLEDWNHCLDSQLQGAAVTKMLVRSKTDIERQPDPAAQIQRFLEQCRFDGEYYRISSTEGDGIGEFRKALYERLEWIPVVELELFAQLREWVTEAWDEGRSILSIRDLEMRARKESPDFTTERFQQAVLIVLAEGLAVELELKTAGQRVLVNLEPLERYAGSIILEAMRADKASPVVEYQWAFTTAEFPQIKPEDRLQPRAEELQMVECAVAILVERHLCLAVQGMLVFPQLFAERGPAPPRTSDSVRAEFAYEFAGAIEHVYATLAVRLALLRQFGEPRYWKDRAEFRRSSAVFFGVELRRAGDRRFGKGEIEIYFSTESPEPQRQAFYAAVREHLKENRVSLDERQKFTCQETGKAVPAEIVDYWQEQGQAGACPYCGRPEFSLWTPVAEEAGRMPVEFRHEREKMERPSVPNISIVREKEGSIRILHLTDLHFRAGQDPVTLAQPLLTDLRNKLNVSKVDYVVVSGDFADRCNEDGFRIAEKFLRALLDEGLAPSPQRLILVPGNHDLIRERDSFLDVSQVSAGGWSRQHDLGFWVRSPKYMDRFRRFYDLHKVLTQEDYPVDEKEQCAVRPFEADRLQFLLLNTAWETDAFQQRIGSLNADAVARAHLKMKPNFLTIAVWHHALAEKNDYQLQPESIESLANNGVRIVLHGHVHEQRTELKNPYYSLRKQMHMMGCGAFGAKKDDRPEGMPCMYNLLEIPRDHRRFKIVSREQRQANGPFEAHAVWPKDGNENEKTAELKVNLV